MTARIVIAALCGLVFGIGLVLSGMTDTRIVLGFLDISGDWNPALLMVMVGALAVATPGFWLVQKRARPLLAERFHTPEKTNIDAKLMIGAVLFGIGWGLYGYCPGPALASLATFDWQPVLFVAAMGVGMLVEKLGRG